MKEWKMRIILKRKKVKNNRKIEVSKTIHDGRHEQLVFLERLSELIFFESAIRSQRTREEGRRHKEAATLET